MVATVVAGVNRKMTTDSVVTARTNVVTNPTRSEPPSIGTSTSRKPRSFDAPRLVAASSRERSTCRSPATAAWYPTGMFQKIIAMMISHPRLTQSSHAWLNAVR